MRAVDGQPKHENTKFARNFDSSQTQGTNVVLWYRLGKWLRHYATSRKVAAGV
jgi:hypothetical protein